MLEPDSYRDLGQSIRERMVEDRSLLDKLRQDVRPLRNRVRTIQQRGGTTVSLVGTDGGNNRLQFDPYLVQIVRVVDSSNNELSLEAITPTTNVRELSARQFGPDGTPHTPLGQMMSDLGVHNLPDLSPMIRYNDNGRITSPSWVQVYRELVEWATLYSLIRTRFFGNDTIVLYDGLLRSKVFEADLFRRYLRCLQEVVDKQWASKRRRIYLAGIAKHSKVLSRYRLAMALEHVLTTDYSAYVEVPRSLEQEAYVWPEYARGDDSESEGEEANKFVGGKMFFVKFGRNPRDPVWPVDIFESQLSEAQTVIGCMLSDALNGFPVPFYPQSLQKAHENAALVDFDFDILQDQIYSGIRGSLGNEGPALDTFRLQDADPSQNRYS